MAQPKRVGNRRLFKLPNHRVTREAVEQVAALIESAAITQNVALFGRGPRLARMGGVLSNWTYSVQSGGGATLLRFQRAGWLGYTDDEGVAKVVRYVPRRAGQMSTIVITGFMGPPSSAVIMWRRQTFPAVPREEAEWVIPTGPAESSVATMEQEVVEFAISPTPTTPPASLANGWRILGFIEFGPTAQDVKVKFYPFIESAFALEPRHRFNRSQTWPGHPSYYTGPVNQVVAPSDGLAYHIRRLIDQLYMLQSKEVSISEEGDVVRKPSQELRWYFKPKLHTSQFFTTLAQINARTTDYNNIPRPKVMVVLEPVFNPASGGFVEFKLPKVVWGGGDGFTVTASVSTTPGTPTPTAVTHDVNLTFNPILSVALVDLWQMGQQASGVSAGEGFRQVQTSTAIPTPGAVGGMTVRFVTNMAAFSVAARIVLLLWGYGP